MGERQETATIRPAVVQWRDFEPSWLPGGLDAPLATEYMTYRDHLDELLPYQGQYVAIKEERILGYYADRMAAVKAGIEEFGPCPMLIKRIVESEPVRHLGGVDV